MALIAYVDPKTGNMNINNQEGSQTSYQKQKELEYLAKGYATVTDPNIIKQLQSGTSANNANTADAFANRASMFSAPSAIAIENAKKSLAEMQAKNTSSGIGNTTNNSYTPSSGDGAVGNTQTLQERLVEAQRNATLASLDKARNQSLSALQQEEAKVAPQFAQQRSQTRTTSQLGAKSFADFMAQRGLQASGGSALGETQRLGALQGALGGLQVAEQNTLANIGARRTGIEQGYQSDIASAEANIQAQALQNAINQANADKLAQEQALQNAINQANADKLAQEQASATQRQQFIDTAGQYANNYQGQINNVLGDNDPTNDWQADILGALRQQKIASQGLDQQGNVIPTDNTVSYSISQALEATRQGMWNQQIANALGLPFTEQSRRTVVSSSGGSVQPTISQPTNNTAFYENNPQVAYKELSNLITQGLRTTDPIAKIQNIKDNYAKYIGQYGKDVVDTFVQDLYASTQPQEPIVEEPTVQPIADIKNYQDYVKRYLEDENGKLVENDFIDYLERISQSDPEGAKELARIYGYQAY